MDEERTDEPRSCPAMDSVESSRETAEILEFKYLSITDKTATGGQRRYDTDDVKPEWSCVCVEAEERL